MIATRAPQILALESPNRRMPTRLRTESNRSLYSRWQMQPRRGPNPAGSRWKARNGPVKPEGIPTNARKARPKHNYPVVNKIGMAELKRGGKLLLFVELDFSWRKREYTPVIRCRVARQCPLLPSAASPCDKMRADASGESPQNVRQALRTKCLSHGYSRNPDNTKR
jgi:hypothetical protein